MMVESPNRVIIVYYLRLVSLMGTGSQDYH